MTLGTDGFGRSDTRQKLRQFFEVDRHHIVLKALQSLVDQEAMPATCLAQARERYGLSPDRPASWAC